MAYGRTVLGTTGSQLMVLANLDRADWKAGGITLDWTTVTAVGADTTTLDGTTIKNGQKYIEAGTVLCKITSAEQQTVTVANATGGTFTVTGTNPATGVTATSAAIAYNATAAVFQTAIEAIFGVGNVSVSLSGGVYTINFVGDLGRYNVAQVTVTDSTTGSGHAVTPATVSQGGATNFGYYGPYSSSATDGRQNLTPGECYVLNEMVAQNPPLGFGAFNTDNPAVFDGGLVWPLRLQIGDAGQPTLAAFRTAFPRISYAETY